MKINKIKINSYGKLKEKEIELKDGINIIYGENESGKSTLLRCIINSFYGISKNKKGKEYSDLEKYTPWTGDEFSGKLEYELDNKNKYEIFRDFKKKNPKIFNSQMEDISKEFNIDKTKGNEFFYEQTKVDEELFLSTVVVGQQEVKLGQQEQNVLIQKIANLVGTGDDNVSYKKAIERITRRQLDEIGTERSREKPINIIDKKIGKLEIEKQELYKYKDLEYEVKEKVNEIKEQISDLENETNLIREIKKIKEKENFEKEKVKIQKDIQNENNEKINLIQEEINEVTENNKDILENDFNKIANNKKIKREKEKINKKILLMFLIVIVFNIIQFIFIKNIITNLVLAVTIPVCIVYIIIQRKVLNNYIKKQEYEDKNKQKDFEKVNSEISNLNQEIRILEENNNNLQNKILELNNNLELKINLEKEKIKKAYINIIDENIINEYINLDNINYAEEMLQKELSNKKIQLNSQELEEKNIKSKMEKLSIIEEELYKSKNELSNLKKNNVSFELAKEVLLKAYEEMKNTITPKFTQELSRNISEITNNKYNKIKINDENGLMIEIKNGSYIPANKLSVGTIEQLYLSLRLSMVNEISEEKMPIILDEVFAYYDSKRLENSLKYISKKFNENQIIIFTCTNREEKILEKSNIKFNRIEL